MPYLSQIPQTSTRGKKFMNPDFQYIDFFFIEEYYKETF